MQDDRWLFYEDIANQDFIDETVRSCYIGKLFHFWEGRNAWWGFWSETYPGIYSFNHNMESTKRKVEGSRTKGSQWIIFELPVLVLSGDEDALIVGEINTTSPLENARLPKSFPLSIDSLAGCFLDNRPNMTIRIVAAKGFVGPATFPFIQFRSRSRGGGEYLDWLPDKLEIDFTHMLQLEARILKQLSRE